MPTKPRLRSVSSSPFRPQVGRDLLVWKPGSGHDLVSATIHRIDDVQPVLDVRDRGVIR